MTFSNGGEVESLTIREYHSSDLEYLTALIYDDLGYPNSIESMKIRMEFIEANPLYYTFMATIADQVVGMVGVRLVHYYEGDGIVTQKIQELISN